MAKRFHKIRFNEQSLAHEEVPFALRDYVWFFALRTAVVVGVGAASIAIFDRYFESPTDRAREREIAFLEQQVERLTAEVKEMEVVLGDIETRDDAIYRSIFGTDPFPEHLRNPGVGGADRTRHMRGYEHSDAIVSLSLEVAELQRKLVSQSRSFDEVLGLAKQKQEMLLTIPAIQPVRNEDLKRMASGYGYRIHPIYKVRKFHYGMDFSAPTGTEIFATGDGVIEKVSRQYNGYGRHVVVRHGFGYQTLYAHMSKILVREGQTVKRGEVIGLVGNTGTSVAPHLHYEVHKDGKKVNPAHYYFNDLTPEQYEEMLMKNEAPNQSFD